MKRILTGAAAMRREGRLQQREDRLSTKNADLKAEVERLRKELIGVVAVLSAEVDFIASLTAENERLRALVIRAYAEGFGDAWAIAHENLNQVAEHDICWGLSQARAALQPKEGEI